MCICHEQFKKRSGDAYLKTCRIRRAQSIFVVAYTLLPFLTIHFFSCVCMCHEQLKRRSGNAYLNTCILRCAQSSTCACKVSHIHQRRLNCKEWWYGSSSNSGERFDFRFIIILALVTSKRDNVVYWKTNRKIKNDLQWRQKILCGKDTCCSLWSWLFWMCVTGKSRSVRLSISSLGRSFRRWSCWMKADYWLSGQSQVECCTKCSTLLTNSSRIGMISKPSLQQTPHLRARTCWLQWCTFHVNSVMTLSYGGTRKPQ